MEFIDIVKKDMELLQDNLNNHFDDTNISFEDDYSFYLERSFIYDLITEKILKRRKDLLRWERIDYFKNKFLKLYENKFRNTSLTWIWFEHHYWFDIENLMRSLYEYLLNEYINGFKELHILLEKCMLEFHNFLEQKQLPIEIWVYLEGLNLNSKLNLDSEFDLFLLDDLISLYSNGHSFRQVDCPYLVKKTIIKAKIEFIDEVYDSTLDPVLLEEWKKNWDEINLILFSFYLSGLNFSYNKWVLKSPWWIDSELFNLDLPYEEWDIIKPKAESLFEMESKLDSEKIITRIHKIRKLITDSDIMNNPKSQLLINRYFQIFDRKSTQDRILDEFIILESIYTGSSKSEISFRLSLNTASFLGDNKEEFDEIYKFIKDIYSIRSAIVHGDEWKTRLRKKEITKHFNLKNNSINTSDIAKAIFLRLKHYIDKSILKIMKWEVENQESFFDKAKGLFYINNRFQ
jgi:hypothetical protein